MTPFVEDQETIGIHRVVLPDQAGGKLCDSRQIRGPAGADDDLALQHRGDYLTSPEPFACRIVCLRPAAVLHL